MVEPPFDNGRRQISFGHASVLATAKAAYEKLRSATRGRSPWLQVPVWWMATGVAVLFAVFVVPFALVVQSSMSPQRKWAAAGAYAVFLLFGLSSAGSSGGARSAPEVPVATPPSVSYEATLRPSPTPRPIVVGLLFQQSPAQVMVPTRVVAQPADLPVDAGGAFEYQLFNDEKCSGAPVRLAGVRPFVGGVVEPSDPTTFQSIGRVFWRVEYVPPAGERVRSGCAEMFVVEAPTQTVQPAAVIPPPSPSLAAVDMRAFYPRVRDFDCDQTPVTARSLAVICLGPFRTGAGIPGVSVVAILYGSVEEARKDVQARMTFEGKTLGATTLYRGRPAHTSWRATFSYLVGFNYGRVGIVIESQRQGSTARLTELYAETFAIHYLEALRTPEP